MRLYGRYGRTNESNIYVPQSDEMRERFGRVICFGGPNSIVELTPGSSAEVLCTRSSLTWENGPPLQDFHSGMEYDSSEPAVTVNDYGKGRAIYICGDVGSGYDLNPLPQLKRFVASLLETTTAPIELDGPRVELSATWRGEKELSVHLLNNPLPLLPWSIAAGYARSYFYPGGSGPGAQCGAEAQRHRGEEGDRAFDGPEAGCGKQRVDSDGSAGRTSRTG